MMQQMTPLDIETKAREVLAMAYGGKVLLPISLELIARKLGLLVKSGEFEDDAISGSYDKKKKTIYVAADEWVNRQAFTIAHEIGHYVLHENKQSDLFNRMQIVRLGDETQKEEKEANRFAAALLMPENQVKHYFSITHNIDDLSIVFGVSPSAITYRLKNLHLIN